jgi:anti-sigma regulatory factor (Ser/Thr protein kinase)
MTSLSVKVARELESLPQVMELVEAFFLKVNVDSKVRFSVELALEEIFTNVVRHNSSGKGLIGITLGFENDEMIITVTDFDAPRFDPVADSPVVDVEAPLEERTAGGLGIHLVKKIMDRIEYSHRDRTGTITMHKRVN